MGQARSQIKNVKAQHQYEIAVLPEMNVCPTPRVFYVTADRIIHLCYTKRGYDKMLLKDLIRCPCLQHINKNWHKERPPQVGAFWSTNKKRRKPN